MRRLRSLPEQPVMRDLYRAYPTTCKPLGELAEAAMRGPSPFTQGVRELIAGYVSGLNACAYSHDAHVGVAEACGIKPDLIKALLTDIETAPLEARMKPILRYARKLTLSPARMTEADAAAVYDAGWDDEALYSTVLVTLLFNFYNRLVDGVGLDLSEGYAPEAAKRLSTKGYDVFAHMGRPSLASAAVDRRPMFGLIASDVTTSLAAEPRDRTKRRIFPRIAPVAVAGARSFSRV